MQSMISHFQDNCVTLFDHKQLSLLSAIPFKILRGGTDWKKSRMPPTHFIFFADAPNPLFFAYPPHIFFFANAHHAFYFFGERPPTQFYFLFRVRPPPLRISNALALSVYGGSQDIVTDGHLRGNV